MINPDNARQIAELLVQRSVRADDFDLVNSGRFQILIGGIDRFDFMNETRRDDFRRVMRDHAQGRIAEVDEKLAKLGVVFGTTAEPIPEYIFYSAAADCFYDRRAKGSGLMDRQFYDRWIDRKDEFPIS